MQGCWPTPQEFDSYVSYFITPGVVLVGQWIFSAWTQSMPDPTPDSSRLYVTWFKFAHTIAGNINLVRRPFQDASGNRHATKPEGESV